MDTTADETWAACQKLEKSLMKLLKSGPTTTSTSVGEDPTGELSSELEYLRRAQVGRGAALCMMIYGFG